jgi:hypothetical protein
MSRVKSGRAFLLANAQSKDLNQALSASQLRAPVLLACELEASPDSSYSFYA